MYSLLGVPLILLDRGLPGVMVLASRGPRFRRPTRALRVEKSASDLASRILVRTFRRDVLVPFVASLLLLVSKALVARSDALVPSSFLLLVVRPGATTVAS